ncbi:MAG TPA: O-antigen ligase family protein [Pyrinomonadaceae bacterium]|nr:O-antigen ligase family protein [Pyrinomonadaceae bacterium]
MARSSFETPPPSIAIWIERGIIGCIVLISLFAPHSIAVTQSAWLLGMTLWLLRFVFYPRPALFRSPIDYAMLSFFVLSGISGVFSYNPVMSIGKMRAASLFTIVYLVSQNVGTLKLVRMLAYLLIASCMVNVALTGLQLATGRGVKVYGVKAESPLARAIFHTRTVTQPTPIKDGDIIWEVDGKKVNSPEEIASALASGAPKALVRIYRIEWIPVLEVPRAQLLTGNSALEQLGIQSWSRGRDWRATGFYGVWVTYAEVLQLIASLALGFFLALSNKKGRTGLLLVIAIAGLLFALAMTVTRASWIGLAISAALMLLLTSSRRTVVIVCAFAIPLVIAGVFLLKEKRSIGFFDASDQSTSWRQTVWREGFDLLISKPRHLLVGVGQDSIKAYWREWGLFDNGRQPVGHMHSNLLQLALERGVPALVVWLILIGVYARMLWQLQRRATDDFQRGLLLGALGGLAGFFVSGLVHYNWGDSEVVTVLYFIMGLTLVVERLAGNTQHHLV